MGRAVAAAENAAGAIAHAIPGGVADRGLLGFDDHFDDTASATAVFAVTPGIGAELVRSKEQREASFSDLEAAELDAAGSLPFRRRPANRRLRARHRRPGVPERNAR